MAEAVKPALGPEKCTKPSTGKARLEFAAVPARFPPPGVGPALLTTVALAAVPLGVFSKLVIALSDFEVILLRLFALGRFGRTFRIPRLSPVLIGFASVPRMRYVGCRLMRRLSHGNDSSVVGVPLR